MYLTATVTTTEANFDKLPLPRSFCGPPFEIGVASDVLSAIQTGNIDCSVIRRTNVLCVCVCLPVVNRCKQTGVFI